MRSRDLVFALVAEAVGANADSADRAARPARRAARSSRPGRRRPRSPARCRGRGADGSARHRVRTRSRSPPTATGAARPTACAIGRPALIRLLEELVDLGVEQMRHRVSGARLAAGRTRSAAPRLDGRGGSASTCSRSEAARCARRRVHDGATASARVHDSARAQSGRPVRFLRRRTTSARIGARRCIELMNQGYEDAYQQFIEPVVGASGERRRAR